MDPTGEYDPGEDARAELVARGLVQGVFYRDTMRRAAETGGLAGSAVNLPDGSVRVIFEGPAVAVLAAIEVAREGSPRAQVDELDIAWSEPRGERGFTTG
ncbi:MAG: acylphosphatase [Actinobacteria bacterium]|nr:acylphosphatase [Actinomycetota bacterium]